LALFAVVPLGIAYLYAADKIPFLPWGSARRASRGLVTRIKTDYQTIDKAFDRQKEREERERLRKLFEASLIEDPEDKRG
jgi:hypothetical protein